MPERNDLEDIEEEEELKLNVPPEFRDLEPRQLSRSVSKLADDYAKGKLSLQPEFQRDYVWDERRASRFVESLLLNLPVPPIFVAENEDGSYEVVDGHQRLQSLFGFLRQLPGGSSKGASVPSSFRALKLKGLEVLHDLNGDGIDDLPAQHREKLQTRILNVISIPKKADPDLRFVLFERLNLGAVALNAQELRNCIHRGPYNALIRELAAEGATLAFLGRKTASKRMKERELVLRVFALLHGRADYRIPFTMFLNDEMERFRYADIETIQRFRWDYHKGIEWTKRIFKQNACTLFRPGDSNDANGRWDTWNELIYEVETVTAAEFTERFRSLESDIGDERFDLFLRGLRSSLIDVMCGSSFRQTFSQFTRSPENTRLRFSLWTGKLSRELDNPEDTISNYEALLEAVRLRPFCDDCGDPISSVVDANLKPNSTIAVHRSCFLRMVAGMQDATKARIKTAQ